MRRYKTKFRTNTSGQICNQYKWCYLVAKYTSNALLLIQVAPPGGQIFKYCKCIVDQICQDEYGLTDSHSLIGSFWRTSVATAPLEIFCRKGRYCLNIGKLPQEIKGGRQVFIWRILQSSYLMRVHCALCTQKAIWDSSNFFRCGPSQSCRLKT